MLPRIPRTRCTRDEICKHLESIMHVPVEIFPRDELPHLALLGLAAAGYDTYCYASGGELTGTWVVWLEPLADVRPDKSGRVPIAEWRERWRELIAEMGIEPPREGGEHAE